MSRYTEEQIVRELNKVVEERVETRTRLLRVLLSLASTLLTILLPLSLFAGLSLYGRICLLCGGVLLFFCVGGCIAGLLLQKRQLVERFRNLSAYLCNFEEYSQLPLSAQFELLSVPDGKWNERLTSISLICLCVAMIALLATLFQILLS